MLNSDLDLQKPRICLRAKFLVITLHLCCDHTHTHTHTHTAFFANGPWVVGRRWRRRRRSKGETMRWGWTEEQENVGEKNPPKNKTENSWNNFAVLMTSVASFPSLPLHLNLPPLLTHVALVSSSPSCLHLWASTRCYASTEALE